MVSVVALLVILWQAGTFHSSDKASSGGTAGDGNGVAEQAVHGPEYNTVPAGRVAEIRSNIGIPRQSPQYFIDNIAMEFNSDNNRPPPLGPTTHHSASNGLWSDAAVWAEGQVPGANAIVEVGHNITYDVSSDVKLRQIWVLGAARLRWATDKDTLLWMDTVTSYGVVEIGTYWYPIPESTTPAKPRAEVVFWQSAAPGATTNLGWNFFGHTDSRSSKIGSAVYRSVGQRGRHYHHVAAEQLGFRELERWRYHCHRIHERLRVDAG